MLIMTILLYDGALIFLKHGGGYGGLYLSNLFAVRTSDPKDMKTFHTPVGGSNDNYLESYASQSDKIVCSWGNHGNHLNRSQYVFDLLSKNYTLYCLGTTNTGQPRHPLNIRGDKTLEVFDGAF